MDRKFYFLSSVCFLIGGSLALKDGLSPVSTLNLAGCLFFCTAASIGLFGKQN